MKFLEHYLKEESDIQYLYYYEDDEDSQLEDSDIHDVFQLAKDNNINILSDKDLYCVAKSDGNVVGGLWTDWTGSEFSFDIVVSKSSQGKGIGSSLIKIAIGLYDQDKEAYDESSMKIDVVNKDVMVPLLTKFGFTIEQDIPNHTIMVRK